MQLSVSEILKKIVEGINGAKDYLSKKVQETGDYLSEKVKNLAGQYGKLQEEANNKLVDACDKLGVNLASLSSAIANAVKAIRDSIGNGGKDGKKLNGTSSNRVYKEDKPKQPEGVKQISGPGMPKNITVSSDKGDSGAGKYSVAKDKQADKNISVGKKPPAKKKEPEYDPPPYRKPRKEPKSKDSKKSKPDPEKGRKKPKSKDLPQADAKSDRRDKKSSDGGIKKANSGKESTNKSEYAKGTDFNKVVNQISSIQQSVSGVITAVDKVAETGDLTPLVNELSNIPGPLGQIASVASQSFKIGNQMYEFYMKRLGGQEKYNKDLKDKQDYINNKKFKTTEDANNARKDSIFKGYIDYLRKHGLATEKELTRLVKQYFNGSKNEKGAAYTEAGNRTRKHQQQADDKNRLGKEYDKLEKQEQNYEADSAKRNKARQDSIAAGKFKAGSDKDYEIQQQNILKDKEELQKLLAEAKKVGAGSKVKHYQALIKAKGQDFEKISSDRDIAAVDRETLQKKHGMTIEDKIKALKEKHARIQMQMNALPNSDELRKRGQTTEITDLEKKAKELSGQSQKVFDQIQELEKQLAQEKKGAADSSNVVMSSDCGQKLDDLKSMLDTELSDGNIKKSVDKILEELKKYYPSGDNKPSGTADSAATSDIGFGGDVEGDNLSTPPTTGITSGNIIKSALGASRSRLAHEPGIARATINLPATATTPQQSTNDVHQTLKKVKEILDQRLPGSCF